MHRAGVLDLARVTLGYLTRGGCIGVSAVMSAGVMHVTGTRHHGSIGHDMGRMVVVFGHGHGRWHGVFLSASHLPAGEVASWPIVIGIERISNSSRLSRASRRMPATA
jgi:hypothetical protein